MGADLRAFLTDGFSEPVRDPLWRHIYLPGELKRLTETPAFQKLGRIRQLGPAFLVYPGATHTRLAHSLGVFHLTRLMLLSLRPDLSVDGARALLCAALCHDLGHFPYTHALKELPLTDHEVLSGREIEALAPVISDWTDAKAVAAIVDTDRPCSDPEILYCRKILSGVLDPDKLDYLNRDATFCGVPYGLQDIDFIFSRLVSTEDGPGLREDGIPAVENLLFSKYLMYRSVYWHKNVRAATAMIKTGLHRDLKTGRIRADGLYGLDDQEFHRRFGKENALIEGVFHRQLFEESLKIPAPKAIPPVLLDLESRDRTLVQWSRETGWTGALPILDIPEPISFEIDLPLVGDTNRRIAFSEAATAFTPETVGAMTDSLRQIRLFVPRGMDDKTRRNLGALLEGAL